MKRIFLSLVVVFGLMLSPTPFANAATEGCPNNWSIDNSITGGWAELNQAKARLGSSMVLEFDEYSMIYSDYSGELGPMPKPSVNLLGVPDLYLYGNTKVAFKITVQVKDCQGKTDFLLQGGSLKQYLGLKANPTFIQMNASDFATNRSNSFIDFVKAREFPACIASLTKGITSRAAASGVSSYQSISPRWPVWNSEFCGLYTGGSINAANPILLNLTPGCSLVDAESDKIPRRLGISVAPNKTCEFAFAFSASLYPGTEAFLGAAINARDIQTPIYVLESFKVSGPVTKKTTITCIKGKLTKKETGINPKCPAGYKKK